MARLYITYMTLHTTLHDILAYVTSCHGASPCLELAIPRHTTLDLFRLHYITCITFDYMTWLAMSLHTIAFRALPVTLPCLVFHVKLAYLTLPHYISSSRELHTRAFPRGATKGGVRKKRWYLAATQSSFLGTLCTLWQHSKVMENASESEDSDGGFGSFLPCRGSLYAEAPLQARFGTCIT